jgi:hypothetical protein
VAKELLQSRATEPFERVVNRTIVMTTTAR